MSHNMSLERTMCDWSLGLTESERLVNRLKNTNPEKFVTMVKMHLSFLLDLPGTTLADFLGEETTPGQSDKIRHSFLPSFKKKSTKVGDSRSSSTENIWNEALLDMIYPLIDYLSEPHCLNEEGLFRKTGHIGRQRLLRQKLQEGEELDLQDGSFSPHDCACLLKTFLSELPEPILLDKYYMAYCQTNCMTQYSKRLQSMQLLIQLLPRENVALLAALLDLLYKVSQHESSKMTSDTIGTLFVPHIVLPKRMSPKEIQSENETMTETVSFMIQHSSQLFCVPDTLVQDIRQFWEQMEEGTDSTPGSVKSLDTTDSGKPMSRYRKRFNPHDIVINTTVSFADRQMSAEACAETDTETEVAKLYAHISAMPPSAKKRKLMKQFTKHRGTYSPAMPQCERKHKRTKSLGESIKKMVSNKHKRRGSGHTLQVPSIPPLGGVLAESLPANTCTPQIRRAVMVTPQKTPVQKLFTDKLHKFPNNDKENSKAYIIDLKHDTRSSLCSRRPDINNCDSPLITTDTKTSMLKSFVTTDTKTSMLKSFSGEHIQVDNNENQCFPDTISPPTVGETKKYNLLKHGAKLSHLSSPNHLSIPKLLTSPKLIHRRSPQGVKPCALVSPMTHSPVSTSIARAPRDIQKIAATPGSRKPMALIQSP